MRNTKPKIDWGDQLSEPVKRIKTFVAYTAPEPGRFDPMKEPFWTLPMALAWIIWRSPDWVRTQWEHYDFHLRDLNRYADNSRIDSGLVDLSDLALWTTDDYVPQTFIQNGLDAKADLRRQLQSGDLVATGKPAGVRERRTITTSEWFDIDLLNREGLEDSVGNGPLRFNKVVVPSLAVLRIWPPILEVKARPGGKPNLPEAQLRAKLTDYIEGCLREGSQPKKTHFIDNLLKNFKFDRSNARVKFSEICAKNQFSVRRGPPNKAPV
jgi:hypothetical protein